MREVERISRAKAPDSVGLTPVDLRWLPTATTDAAAHGDRSAVRRLIGAAQSLTTIKVAEARKDTTERTREAFARLINPCGEQVEGRTPKQIADQVREAHRLEQQLGGARYVPMQKKRQSAALLAEQRLRQYWADRAAGRDALHFPHPLDSHHRIKARWEEMNAAAEFEKVSMWRRWTARWYGQTQPFDSTIPEYMKPKVKGSRAARKPTEDRTLIAKDQTHELGLRHDMLRLFTAVGRREQVAAIELTRLATGTTPAWMAAKPEAKRGPKPKHGGATSAKSKAN